MPFVILPTNSASGGYDITNSLRFNSGSSDYLNRTPASAGNRQKFTISFWVKRSALSSSTSFTLLSAGADGTEIRFTQDKFRFYYYSGAYIGQYFYQSTAVFRDVSAWYHLVIAVDTTQATAGNRLKMYVNGVEGAVAETTISQNASTDWNNNGAHYIGKFSNGSMFYFDGYMSDIYSIDGQQLTPTSFGETDEDTGIWKPKAYTGTYGTNGFYLQFKNSASLGTDSSGNGNTFTVNNLTSIDQTTDTPTNNYCTLNPNNSNSALATLSQGNTVYTGTSADNNGIASATFGLNGTGKWYWEAKIINASTGYPRVGVIIDFDSVSQTTRDGGYATSQMFPTNVKAVGVARGQTTLFSLSGDITITAPANNDIIQFAVDRDNGAVYIGNNGTWYNSGVPTSGASRTGAVATFTASGTTNMFVTSDYNGSSSNLNFGNPSYTGGSYTDGAGYGNFSYSVPAGFYSLNTKNLAQFG